MTALDTANTQDIDALLAEADSLMDEMAASVGPAAEETADAEAAAPAESQDAAALDEEVAGLVEELTAAARSVDTAAVVADAADGGAGNAAPSDTVPDSDSTPTPSAAPADWVEEARTSGEAGTTRNLPTIPDEQAGPSEQAEAALSPGEGRVRRLADASTRMLISILAAIDYPFARLGPRIKEIIGIVAIATLMTAVAAWFVGPYLVASVTH